MIRGNKKRRGHETTTAAPGHDVDEGTLRGGAAVGAVWRFVHMRSVTWIAGRRRASGGQRRNPGPSPSPSSSARHQPDARVIADEQLILSLRTLYLSNLAFFLLRFACPAGPARSLLHCCLAAAASLRILVAALVRPHPRASHYRIIEAARVLLRRPTSSARCSVPLLSQADHQSTSAGCLYHRRPPAYLAVLPAPCC